MHESNTAAWQWRDRCVEEARAAVHQGSKEKLKSLHFACFTSICFVGLTLFAARLITVSQCQPFSLNCFDSLSLLGVFRLRRVWNFSNARFHPSASLSLSHFSVSLRKRLSPHQSRNDRCVSCFFSLLFLSSREWHGLLNPIFWYLFALLVIYIS